MNKASQVSPGDYQTLQRYRALVRRRYLLLGIATILLIGSFLLDLITGPSGLPLSELLRVLRSPGDGTDPVAVIVWELRLPSAVMAILVGAAITLAGTEMQTTLNNPLASPFTLGLSSAAILGAALAIVLGIRLPGVPDDWIISANAFLFAIATVSLLRVMTRARSIGVEGLVLFGTALFFTFNALVSILQFVAGQQALQQLVFWTMGSLDRATWSRIRILLLLLLLVVPWSWASSWRLTALRLGEDRARSLGVDVQGLRRSSLLRVALLTATATAFTGTLPFVGLAGPHIARLLVGEDHRFFIPASLITGALVVSLASVLSKAVIPGALVPIGLVTALIGVPFFLSLLLTRRSGL